MSKVVPIRPTLRRFRQRAQDQDAIIHARLAAPMHLLDGGISATAVHALAGMAADAAARLPRNNLRCLSSTLDLRRDFDLRCAEVERARAVVRKSEAQRQIDDLLHGGSGCLAFSPDHERLEGLLPIALLDMASVPVSTRADLARKKRLIGRRRLAGDGGGYQQLRDAVAADEARLARPGVGTAGARRRAAVL